MNKQNNLRIIWEILFRPDAYFKGIAAGLPELRPFIVSYGVPLVILAAAGRMTRLMLLAQIDEAPLRGDQLSGIFLITITAYALSVYLGSYFVSKLAPAFKSESDRDKSMLIIMLAYTPYMLAQALSFLIPELNGELVLGLIYTVVLFGVGASHLLNTPISKVWGFTLVSYFVIFSISFLSMLLLTEMLIFAR